MVLDSWFPCWHNQSEVCKLLGNSLLTQTILWSMMQQHLIDCSPFIARYILSFVFCVPQTEWSWFLYQQHTLPTWLAPWPQCYSHLDPGKGLVICSCLQRLKTVFIHLQTNGISRTYPIKTLHCWSQQTWTQTFLYSLKRKTIGPAYCCNIWCSFLPPHTSARLSLGTYRGCCFVNEIVVCSRKELLTLQYLALEARGATPFQPHWAAITEELRNKAWFSSKHETSI